MCKCIDLTTIALEGTNTALDIPQRFDMETGKFLPPRLMVATYKVDPKRREKSAKLLAEYCPFCGEKYVDPEERPAAGQSQSPGEEAQVHDTETPR